MVGKILFGLIGIPSGIVMMIYAHKIVDNFFGTIGFAERYLGGGGSYTFIRFSGALIAIVSMLIMFGIGGFIYDSLVTTLGGLAGQ